MTELHRCRFLKSKPPTVVQLNKNIIVTKNAVHILQDTIIINTIHGKFLNAHLHNDFLYLLNSDTLGKLNLKNGQIDVAHSIYNFVDFQRCALHFYVIDGNTIQLFDFDLQVQKTYHHSSAIHAFHCSHSNDVVYITTAHDGYIQVRKNGELQHTMECHQSAWTVSHYEEYILSGHADHISIWHQGVHIQSLSTKLDILNISNGYAIGLAGILYKLQLINDKWSIKQQQRIHSHESNALFVDVINQHVYSAGLDGIIQKRCCNTFELRHTMPLDLLIKTTNNDNNTVLAYANETELHLVHLQVNHTPTPICLVKDEVICDYDLYTHDLMILQTLETVKLIRLTSDASYAVEQQWLGCDFIGRIQDRLYLIRGLNQVEIVDLKTRTSELIHLSLGNNSRINKVYSFEEEMVLVSWDGMHIVIESEVISTIDVQQVLPIKDMKRVGSYLVVLSGKMGGSLHVFTRQGGHKMYSLNADYMKMSVCGDDLYLYGRETVVKVEEELTIKRKNGGGVATALKVSDSLKQYKDIEAFDMWEKEEGVVVERPISTRIANLPPQLVGLWR